MLLTFEDKEFRKMALETAGKKEKGSDDVDKAVIREDILQSFPGLFGTKKINGREVNVEEAIAALAQELHPEITAVLTARRALLHSPAPVRERYAWPKWDDTFAGKDNVRGRRTACCRVRDIPTLMSIGRKS